MKFVIRIALNVVCWVGAFIGGVVIQMIASALGHEMSITEAMVLAVVVALYDRYMIDRS